MLPVRTVTSPSPDPLTVELPEDIDPDDIVNSYITFSTSHDVGFRRPVQVDNDAFVYEWRPSDLTRRRSYYVTVEVRTSDGVKSIDAGIVDIV